MFVESLEGQRNGTDAPTLVAQRRASSLAYVVGMLGVMEWHLARDPANGQYLTRKGELFREMLELWS